MSKCRLLNFLPIMLSIKGWYLSYFRSNKNHSLWLIFKLYYINNQYAAYLTECVGTPVCFFKVANDDDGWVFHVTFMFKSYRDDGRVIMKNSVQ